MSQLFKINPDNPQGRLIRQAVAIIREGGVVVYPTDSGYAIGCQLEDKAALTRIRALRQLDESHYFTLVCANLSEIARYAIVDNPSFRMLKFCTPGPYTFLLRATSEVPRRLLQAKRKTIGIRIPDNTIVQSLLETLRAPIMSTTLSLPGETTPMIEPDAMRDVLGQRVDLIIDGGYCGVEPTTVVDMTQQKPVLVRMGKGDVSIFT